MATKVLNTKIIIRNDTAVNFANQNPTLLKGEIALELDTKKYKIGNGVSNYVDLPYYNHIDDGKNNKLNILIEMLNNDEFGSVSDIKVNGDSVLDTKTKVASIKIASISYSATSQTSSSDNLTGDGITLHRIAKTGSWNDLLNKPNIVDNLNSTSSTDILSAKQGNELKKLVQAIPQATSFSDIPSLINHLNSVAKNTYVVGHDLYVIQKSVPDFWISGIEDTSKFYSGNQSTLIEDVKNNDYVQIGFFRVSVLETAKVDISNFVTEEELNNAIAELNITDIRTRVNNLENTVGNDGIGLIKEVNSLKGRTSALESSVSEIENDETIIRTTDFVVLNGGDSTTSN